MLDLENTELHELPDVIGTLSGLSAGGCLGLWLGSNELTTLPNSIGNLVALRSLDVDNNKLTALPNSIGNLVCLESLYANHNRLAQLPATIGKLRTLRELRVSDNQLCDEDALPVELGSGLAKCLKSLWLARNGLGALPPAVCGLKALEELDICGNAELCELPMDFDALGRLETLDLAGNEALIWPPSSVWKEASRPAYAVRQWIEKQRKESEEVVYAHEPPGSIHAPMKPEEVGGSTTADGGGEFVFRQRGGNELCFLKFRPLVHHPPSLQLAPHSTHPRITAALPPRVLFGWKSRTVCSRPGQRLMTSPGRPLSGATALSSLAASGQISFAHLSWVTSYVARSAQKRSCTMLKTAISSSS